jgi:hypothetical protein
MLCHSHPIQTLSYQLQLVTPHAILFTRYTPSFTPIYFTPNISASHHILYHSHPIHTLSHQQQFTHNVSVCVYRLLSVLYTQTYIHMQISHENPHNSHRKVHLHPTRRSRGHINTIDVLSYQNWGSKVFVDFTSVTMDPDLQPFVHTDRVQTLLHTSR